MNINTKMNEQEINITVTCPNCQEPILIEKLNCGIFRHGVIKKNGKQMEPHSNKELCEFLKEKDIIYGCGKPFRILQLSNGDYLVETCGYI
jgi:hypothetical protein